MAVTSTSTTEWTGDLASGSGVVALESSGAASLPVNWRARSEGSDATTTPEELIAAAHSACFSMALSHGLTEAGHTPEHITTSASVDFVPGTGIIGIALGVIARVPGIAAADFEAIADETKTACPVSAALAAVPITLTAQLEE